MVFGLKPMIKDGLKITNPFLVPTHTLRFVFSFSVNINRFLQREMNQNNFGINCVCRFDNVFGRFLV